MIRAGDQKLYSALQRRANEFYSRKYARTYRLDDENCERSAKYNQVDFIREVGARFSGPISVLDLGCGAERYFHCFRKLSYLVGLDCALGMLQEAKRPFGSVNGPFGLIQGSVYEIEFKPDSFDLIYSVGVFGHFCPLTSTVLEKARRFLKPGGLLALDVVEWRRTAETWKTRAARRIQPFSFGPLRRYITLRLGNYWMAEATCRELLVKHDFRDIEIRRWIQPHSHGRYLLWTARK